MPKTRMRTSQKKANDTIEKALRKELARVESLEQRLALSKNNVLRLQRQLGKAPVDESHMPTLVELIRILRKYPDGLTRSNLVEHIEKNKKFNMFKSFNVALSKTLHTSGMFCLIGNNRTGLWRLIPEEDWPAEYAELKSAKKS